MCSADWTPEQRALFTRLFRHMDANPAVFTHPMAPPMHPDHWSTIAHNAAWMAADMLAGSAEPYRHVDHRGRVVGVEPSGLPQ